MSIGERALLVGTSFSAIPFLDILKRKGLKVSICGNLRADPGHLYADESFYFDYANKEKLLQLVQKEKFDYIVPSCNDYAYMSCAYVADRLGYPGFDKYNKSQILHTKSLFRKMAMENDLPVPKALAAGIDIDRTIKNLHFPVLVKPVDSFSGRGISKIYNVSDWAAAVRRAKNNSRNREAVVEEFVKGTLYSHSVFIQDGKILTDFFVEEYCTVYPYQVNCSCVAWNFPENLKNKVRRTVSKLINILKLVNGLLHIQLIVDRDNYWLIEPMRRCPGDLYGKLIELSTGVNYYEYYLRPFLGRSIKPVEQTKKINYIARHTISSKTEDAALASWDLTLPAEKIISYSLKDSGLLLKSAPYDKVGIFFAKFKTLKQLHRYTPCLDKYVSINNYGGLHIRAE